MTKSIEQRKSNSVPDWVFEGTPKFIWFRRVFSRFEKLDVMFLGFISFALIADGARASIEEMVLTPLRQHVLDALELPRMAAQSRRTQR